MKLLLLATTYEIGGVSNVIRAMLDNLDRKKFDIVFMVENLAAKHYPLRSDVKFINMAIEPTKGFIGKLINIFRHLGRMRRIVTSEAPDAVIGFTSTVSCPYLVSFLWPGAKMPKTILGDYTEQLFIRQKGRSLKDRIFIFIYRIVMFFLYSRADAIVSVSESLAKHMRKFFLMDSKKIKVIQVPVDIKGIQYMSEQGALGDRNVLPRIGTISRLSAEKGVNYLIEAFSDLIRSMDAELVIVGDGSERKNLEKMTKDLNLCDKVSFLGWQKNPYKHLRSMDVFVLSSLWEGFPTSVVESMACSVPVVATRSVGGVQELIRDGVNGLLVPPKDKKALSDSIRKLLIDKDLRERLTKEALKKTQEFDTNNITGQYESLIAGL